MKLAANYLKLNLVDIEFSIICITDIVYVKETNDLINVQ